MTTPARLAVSFGLTTADRIATPAPRDRDHDRDRERVPPFGIETEPPGAVERWSEDKKRAMNWLAPAAVVLVATDGPVSVTLWGPDGETRRIGHNRGVWPAKIAKTASWRDTVGASYDKNPLVPMSAQFRVWCRNVLERDKLAASIGELIAARSEADGGLDALRHGFADLGPDLDLALFEVEVHDIARRLGLTVWDNDGLSEFLDRVLVRAAEMKRQGRVRDHDDELFERAARKEEFRQ